MSRSRVTKSLAVAVMGLFAAHAATAQQTQSQGVPLESTANFVYFSTGSHALTPEEQDHIRDVAGMMQGTPTLVATIIGKADAVGSADFNERLSHQRAEAVFEALVYTNKVAENRCSYAGLASAYHSYPPRMMWRSHRTGWLRLS